MAPFRGTRKSRQTYIIQAQKLRRLGFAISFRGNKTPNAQQKSAVTRLARKLSAYTAKNRFKFVRVKRSLLPVLRGVVSSQQITPKGFFIQCPVNVAPENFKVQVTKGGVKVQGKNYEDFYIGLDPKKLARDPEKAVRRALGKRKPKFVKVVVNGFESRNAKHELELFWQYWDALVEDLTSDERGQGRTSMTEAQISDVFHLKLIYR